MFRSLVVHLDRNLLQIIVQINYKYDVSINK
jgi:hypothetical protein